MKPEFRKLQVSLIFAILFSSIFITVAVLDKDSGTASAGILDNLFQTNIEMETDGNGSLNPEKQATFKIFVEYELLPPVNALKAFYIQPTKVELDIIAGDAEWLSASLNRRTFIIKPEEKGGKREEVILTVDITPDAPYLEQHIITLKATAEKSGLWQKSEGKVDVIIFPEFLYWLDADRETATAVISPGETHEFTILLDNDASYPVRYHFETKNVPKDWIISQPDSVNVNGKSEERVKVQVISPYEFGYHEVDIKFDVVVTAEPFPTTGDYQPHFVDSLSFTVKNRGFSTAFSGAGIFVIFGIIAILVLTMILFFYFQKRKKKSE